MTDDQLYDVIAMMVGEDCDDWYVACSANLYLQGMNVEVHDLDYVASLEALHHFDTAFASYVVRSCYYRMELPAYTQVMQLGGVEIEGFYHGDPDLDLLDKKEVLLWRGLPVPVLPLWHAQAFYEKIGRFARAKEIADHLRSVERLVHAEP